MTVQQLINALAKFDPDTRVIGYNTMTEDDHDITYATLSKVGQYGSCEDFGCQGDSVLWINGVKRGTPVVVLHDDDSCPEVLPEIPPIGHNAKEKPEYDRDLISTFTLTMPVFKGESETAADFRLWDGLDELMDRGLITSIERDAYDPKSRQFVPRKPT